MTLKAKLLSRTHTDKEEALKRVIQEDSIRLNTLIPISLHNKLKIYAAKKRTTITALVIECINDHMNKNSYE